MPELLYYASGGGHGHVLRGLALLSRLGSGLLVGPARLEPWATALGVRYASPPDGGEEDPDRLRQLREAWLGTLPRPDLLVVDVFPRGIVGELAGLVREVPSWLVTRWVPTAYYLHPPVREALERFELLLWAESPPPALVSSSTLPTVPGRAVASYELKDSTGPPSLVVPPVLLAPKPLSREEARRQLGVPAGTPLLLTLGTGDIPRQERLLRLTHSLGTKLGIETCFVSTDLARATGEATAHPGMKPGDQAVTRAGRMQGVVEPRPHDGLGPGRNAPVAPIACDADTSARVVSLFPLALWLPAADVIVAAGGYHAVHEARASGVPAIFVPQSRRYDDQEARVRGECVARTPEELEARVREALGRPKTIVQDASLGAMLVVRLLQRRMEKGVLSQEEIAAFAGGVGSASSEAPPHLL